MILTPLPPARRGPHILAAPGRHEAEALTDYCETCSDPVQPSAVADDVTGGRCAGRYAIYACAACDRSWLCWRPRERPVPQPPWRPVPQPPWRPTGFMQRVSEFLESTPGSASLRTIRATVKGSAALVDTALRCLVDEGFATAVPVRNAGRRYKSVRPYRESFRSPLCTGCGERHHPRLPCYLPAVAEPVAARQATGR